MSGVGLSLWSGMEGVGRRVLLRGKGEGGGRREWSGVEWCGVARLSVWSGKKNNLSLLFLYILFYRIFYYTSQLFVFFYLPFIR